MVLRFVDDGDMCIPTSTAASSSSSLSSSSSSAAKSDASSALETPAYELINHRRPRVCQILAALSFGAISCDGPALCGMLNGMLTNCQGKAGDYHGADGRWPQVCCVTCDGASKNIAALDFICDTSAGSMMTGADFTHVLCFAHCLNNAGDKIGFNTCDVFWNGFINLMSRSNGAQIIWKQYTGKTFKKHSKTRWFSKLQILRDCHKYVFNFIYCMKKFALFFFFTDISFCFFFLL